MEYEINNIARSIEILEATTSKVVEKLDRVADVAAPDDNVSLVLDTISDNIMDLSREVQSFSRKFNALLDRKSCLFNIFISKNNKEYTISFKEEGYIIYSRPIKYRFNLAELFKSITTLSKSYDKVVTTENPKKIIETLEKVTLADITF